MFDLQIKRKKVGRPKSISPRGLEMMRFIWRFGSCGTKILVRLMSGPKDSAYGISKELLKLEGRGFIFGENDPYASHFTWTMTNVGFQELAPHLAAIYGPLSRRIEGKITDSPPKARVLWYAKNRSTLAVHQLLLNICPWPGAIGATEREIFSTTWPKRLSSAPTTGNHLPAGMVIWPGKVKRAQSFAIESQMSHYNHSSLVKVVSYYTKTRFSKIFVILAREYDGGDSARSLLQMVLREHDAKSRSRYVFIKTDHLGSDDMNVYGIDGKTIGSLKEVLLNEPDQADEDSRFQDLVDDIYNKTKVWGRAYHRRPGKPVRGQ